ncbi:MAG: threonine/serine exporter family protein [Lachnospiraceae bacterium]|nr:threonine/serine exporter family protein [Lachnospiraceae bacterium]
MNYDKLLQEIIHIGSLLIQSGAENLRVEDSLYRMCKSYGFIQSDIHVIPSNIQATVITKDERVITQICHVRKSGFDFTHLARLNDLCRYVCVNTPDEVTLKEKRLEIQTMKKPRIWLTTLAAILCGGGFAAFYGATAPDLIIAFLASALVALGGLWLAKREENVFIYHFILMFIAEVLVLLLTRLYHGSRPESITDGLIMIFIGSLTITNGIRDVMAKEILSGINNVLGSILGASGVASGIALALLLFHQESKGLLLAPQLSVQLFSAMVACVGFSLWYRVPGRCIIYNMFGGLMTWFIYYCLYYRMNVTSFFATLVAAMFVAAFAYVMARLNKVPATVFLSTTAIPLIPGPQLHYMMYAVVTSDSVLLKSSTHTLLVSCFGIALGFMFFDAFARYTTLLGKVIPNNK